MKKKNWNKHLGAISEITAVKWLICEGYEVFRNVSPFGMADMMIWKPGEIPIPIDVKTFSCKCCGDGSAYVSVNNPSVDQIKSGVVYFYVCHETSLCSFNPVDLLKARGFELRGGVRFGGKNREKTCRSEWTKENTLLVEQQTRKKLP